MDIKYFLNDRTKFVKYFHKNGIKPFNEIIDSIENETEPYIPPYSEDGEPAYLEEWLEAKTGIEAINHASLSMLSSSLQLFLKEWVNRFNRNHGIQFNANFKKEGWFNGYRQVFDELEINMNECPANIEIIEQVVLVRNRVQHPEEITSLNVRHSDSDLKKYPRPFFSEKPEFDSNELEDNEALEWLIGPSILATENKINTAIEQVELLCSWLENEYWKAKNA